MTQTPRSEERHRRDIIKIWAWQEGGGRGTDFFGPKRSGCWIEWTSFQSSVIRYKETCVCVVCVCVCVCQVTLVLSDSVIPWTVTLQASMSMGFSRQECWSGLPCPPSEDLPNPGIEPAFPVSPALAGGLFTASTTWEALKKLEP